jgi:hypothetical protein
MRLWLKFELLDLEALFSAIRARSAIEKSYLEKLNSLIDEKSTLQKIERKQFTFSSFFLSDA